MVARIDVAKPVAQPKRPTEAPKQAAPTASKVTRDSVALKGPAQYPAVGQVLIITGGAVQGRNTFKFDASPERVMAQFEDNWSNWWPRSSVGKAPKSAGFPKPKADETQFQFKPLNSAASQLSNSVHQFPARAESIGGGKLMMVIPLKLKGTFEGKARIEIREAPDGKTLVTSVLDDVKPKGFAAWGPMPERVAKQYQTLEAAAFKALNDRLKAEPEDEWPEVKDL